MRAGRSAARNVHAVYRLRNPTQSAAAGHAGARGAAVPGQSAGAVPQHRGRREPDPRSRVRERSASASTRSPSVFPRTQRHERSARSRSRRTRRASGSPTNVGSARSSRRERLRVGRAAVRRRSAAGREQEIVLDLPLHRGASRPAHACIARRRRGAVARKAQSRRADAAAEVQVSVRHAAHLARARADQSRRSGDSAGLARVRALVDPRRRDDLGDAAAPRPRGGREGIPAVVRAAISSPTARCRAASIGAARIPCRRTTAPASSCSSSTSVYRYTGDMELLREHVAGDASKRLRTWTSCACRSAPRRTQQGERKAFYGLMPASISHEGYSAKPMHSYWDDFWALAGYESAIRIARALGSKDRDARVHRIARPVPLATCIARCSIAMQTHNIDYLPGAAELGDFDATSTTIALSPVGEQQMLPPERAARDVRALLAGLRGAPHRHELGCLHALRVAQPRHVHPPALARPRHGADRVPDERSAPGANGISGRKSSAASRASRASSATCRTAGSPRTMAARCSTCSRSSGRPTRRSC